MPHEPKRRHSRERKGERRSSIQLKATASVTCPNCGTPTLAHQVCKKCGYYKGREVVKE